MVTIIVVIIIIIIIIIIGPCLLGDKIDPLDQKYLQSNYNLRHNILELCNVLVHIRLTTSKVKRYIQYNKLAIRVAHELLNDLRFRTLGNKEIFGKFESWVETSAPSAPTPPSQEARRSRYQTPLAPSSLTGPP